jgi:hypothetical protein
MARQIRTVRKYRHPKTGRFISDRAARQYTRRTGKRLKPERWLIVQHRYSPADIRIAPYVRRLQGRIEHAVKLTREEKILRVVSLKSRHLRETLGRHRAFTKIFENYGGNLRITISGYDRGRRIKRVMHLPYFREQWRNNYEGFKGWLIGRMIANLTRMRLRLSNRQEVRRVIKMMTQAYDQAKRDYKHAPPVMRGALKEQMYWYRRLIDRKKATRQLSHATIRIEKMA